MKTVAINYECAAMIASPRDMTWFKEARTYALGHRRTDPGFGFVLQVVEHHECAFVTDERCADFLDVARQLGGWSEDLFTVGEYCDEVVVQGRS